MKEKIQEILEGIQSMALPERAKEDIWQALLNAASNGKSGELERTALELILSYRLINA